MRPEYCYIYVKGWKADVKFKRRAEEAADAVSQRECVIVASGDAWPAEVPTPSDSDCATIICGCEGHPHQFVDCTANAYRIRKAFLDAEAKC